MFISPARTDNLEEMEPPPDPSASASAAPAASGAAGASTSGPRSLFDSRARQGAAASSAIAIDDHERAGKDDDDGFITTARYLTHTNSSSSTATSFDEAFAAIKQTASYTKPPAMAVPPSATKDAATVVFVSRRQTGNPLLKAVKNVSLEFRDGLVPDYVINASCCVLFLSVRYHLLHGGYLADRLARVKADDPTPYKTTVVLCLVDVDDNEIALREINRVVLLSKCTLVLAWSWPEAARYIETLKAYENKSASLIKEKVDADFLPQANDVFTTVRSVNKTDVVTLLSTFGSVQGVLTASMEELSLCPGIGAKKVRHLLETFQEPFTKQ
jgi:DNA excision repair protein ERCC-1